MSKDPGYSDSKSDSQGSRIRELEAKIEKLEESNKIWSLCNKWYQERFDDNEINLIANMAEKVIKLQIENEKLKKEMQDFWK